MDGWTNVVGSAKHHAVYSIELKYQEAEAADNPGVFFDYGDPPDGKKEHDEEETPLQKLQKEISAQRVAAEAAARKAEEDTAKTRRLIEDMGRKNDKIAMATVELEENLREMANYFDRMMAGQSELAMR